GTRLTAADRDGVLTLGDDDVSCFGDHAQITGLQVKFDLLTGVRRQMDALKATQRPNRSARNVRKFQVELDDFVPRDRAAVGYRNGDIQRIAGIDWRLRYSHRVILELRIAEAVSERPERLALEVAISAPFHRVVFERRQLLHILVECDRQTPGRIVSAAQGLGNRRPALL